MSSSIVLLSGGLDSSVALGLHIAEGHQPIYCLTFDYGQRARQKEIQASRQISEYFHVRHQVIELPWYGEMASGGALLNQRTPLPSPSVSELDDWSASIRRARAVWVPNRNGVFIEIAASLAEDTQAHFLVTGFNREEAETFPDNSEAYLSALCQSLSFSTSNQVKVISPTVRFNKREIVRKAKELQFPFELLWSCYEDRTRMCGACESCKRLKRALLLNEVSLDSIFENTPL